MPSKPICQEMVDVNELEEKTLATLAHTQQMLSLVKQCERLGCGMIVELFADEDRLTGIEESLQQVWNDSLSFYIMLNPTPSFKCDVIVNSSKT